MTSETQMGILNRMDTLSEIETDRTNYEREFNGFRPKFKGVAQGYYPNTCMTYIKVLCVLLPTYIVCVVGLIFITAWAINDSQTYPLFCFFLLCAYILVSTVVVYFGAFGRLKLERESLDQRREEQLAKMEEKKREREQADRLLREYNQK